MNRRLMLSKKIEKKYTYLTELEKTYFPESELQNYLQDKEWKDLVAMGDQIISEVSAGMKFNLNRNFGIQKHPYIFQGEQSWVFTYVILNPDFFLGDMEAKDYWDTSWDNLFLAYQLKAVANAINIPMKNFVKAMNNVGKIVNKFAQEATKNLTRIFHE